MHLPDDKAILRSPFRAYLFFNRPYWKLYAAGASLALLFVCIELTMPLVVQTIMDRFVERTMTLSFLFLCFGLLLTIAGSAGFARYWQRILMIGASRKFEFDLRNAHHQRRLPAHVCQPGRCRVAHNTTD